MPLNLQSEKAMTNVQITDGTLNASDAANYRFRRSLMVLLSNFTSLPLKYRANTGAEAATAATEASALVYDGLIPPQATVRADYDGMRGIQDISIFNDTGGPLVEGTDVEVTILSN